MWVIPAVLFFLWTTGTRISENGFAFLVYWFSCLQSTPENFIIWIGLVKLFEIIYRRMRGVMKHEKPIYRRVPYSNSACVRDRNTRRRS
jgi:hypothetical protein